MVLIEEKDDAGHLRTVFTLDDGRPGIRTQNVGRSHDFVHLLQGMFLPAGYPASVSSDYMKYQILNGLQAFCSSLAGLIASRAVLQGHGVGQAEASATNALLLTILQDVFSRITTIGSAYYLGTSLSPEAKTYRLLADLFNDSALVLDTLSPHLSGLSIQWVSVSWSPLLLPALVSRPGYLLRGFALCLSGALRSLCGLAAGGSKAALTLHFAQPDNGASTGDISDLSAKDGSKETVLALVGMLCGSALMPYVEGPQATYGLLALLVTAHILFNYIAVRGVTLRSFNRQRTNILWQAYRASAGKLVMTPLQVAHHERIFVLPSLLRDYDLSGRSRIIGHCTIGSSLLSVLSSVPSGNSLSPGIKYFNRKQHPTWSRATPPAALAATLIAVFTDEKYLLWFDAHSTYRSPHLHIILKEGHSPMDHVKAWLHALELAKSTQTDFHHSDAQALLAHVRSTKRIVDSTVDAFMEATQKRQWDIDSAAGGFVVGLPRVVNIVSRQEGERRKHA